ncbi:MAG: N-acetyltransferase [Nitrospirales bacterium]
MSEITENPSPDPPNPLPSPLPGSSKSIEIVPVKGHQAIEQFIHIPWSIYSKGSCWIPPLVLERRQHLSPQNPYFAHAETQLWIAYRNSQPIGRISAQIDELHQARYQDQTGFFGMLEAHDDIEIFQALLSTAEHWLREKGMQRIRGPFNLSINQECGLLINGFDSPPMIMTGHAYPYYQRHVEALGYQKAQDLLAYKIDLDFVIPPVIHKALRKAESSVMFRPLRRSDFTQELRTIQHIFEDAWSKNWGFIPFSQEEFTEVGKELKLLVDESFVQIAEVDGTPEAMLVAFPNVNEMIHDLNGRLLPFGWLKFLWRLKVSLPRTARVALMGVRKKYQGTPLGAVLAFGMIDAVRKAGQKRRIQEVELSWILENNIGMRNMLQAIGSAPYKTYRIYEQILSHSEQP